MFNLIKSIIKYPKGMKYDGADKDESVIYVFRRSLITNIPWVVFSLVLVYMPSQFHLIFAHTTILTDEFKFALGIFWYLFAFGYFFQNYLNWFFNVYIITNKKMVDVDFKGLLYSNISEASLNDIEDVTSNINGVFRVIFNIGTVYIQTAGELREFEFKDVSRPAMVRDLVADLAAQGGNDID